MLRLYADIQVFIDTQERIDSCVQVVANTVFCHQSRNLEEYSQCPDMWLCVLYFECLSAQIGLCGSALSIWSIWVLGYVVGSSSCSINKLCEMFLWTWLWFSSVSEVITEETAGSTTVRAQSCLEINHQLVPLFLYLHLAIAISISISFSISLPLPSSVSLSTYLFF